MSNGDESDTDRQLFLNMLESVNATEEEYSEMAKITVRPVYEKKAGLFPIMSQCWNVSDLQTWTIPLNREQYTSIRLLRLRVLQELIQSGSGEEGGHVQEMDREHMRQMLIEVMGVYNQHNVWESQSNEESFKRVLARMSRIVNVSQHLRIKY